MKKVLFLLLPLVSLVYATEVVYEGIGVPSEYNTTLVSLCVKYKVPVALVARLIECESGWNPNATGYNQNGTRDKGLMQLNSRYMADFAWRYNDGIAIDPYDPNVAMSVGIRYLAHLKALTGSWFGAVASYNCGLTRYRRWMRGEQDIPLTTKRYLEYIFY